MRSEWREVVRVAFKGKRYTDHALDVNALAELSQFQKMIAETAKALWRAANPDRERLPKNFEQRTRLCLRKIEEGSAVAPLEVFIEDESDRLDFEYEPSEVKQAISLAYHVFRAAERDESLPDEFPKSLVAEYSKWGEQLQEDESIEFITNGGEPARVTPPVRARILSYAEGTHEGYVEVTGEVVEANVRPGQYRFQLWLDDKSLLTVAFSPTQESEVTSALKDHRSLRLHVTGTGEFTPQGKPVRMARVDKLELCPVGEPVDYDASVRSIEDVLAELANEIPEDEWHRLPADLTDNLDHYIYGTPKR